MTRAVRVAAIVAASVAASVAATQLHVGDATPTEPRWCTTYTAPNVSGTRCYPTRAELLAFRIVLERDQAAKRAAERAARAYRAGYTRGRRQALSNPDAVMAARLAALAYGQDAGQLLECADSEGWDWEGRYARVNTVGNWEGSGAFGALQFMPSTFASTPQGKAGLPISRVDVQMHAAAWMWSVGRRGEWTGKGC